MIIQCDFDGTITEEDVSFALLDAFARGDWRELFQQYRDGKMSVGEFNTRAFALVKASKEELIEIVRSKNEVRPGFQELVGYCRSRGFRFVIVSNGLDFYIKTILEDIGLGDLEVHAARTRFYRGGLKVQYIGPDGTPLMNDFKEAYARLFLGQDSQLVYIGNGPSDVAPASLAQHIFGRDGMLDGCRKINLKCTPFEDLNDIVRGLKSL